MTKVQPQIALCPEHGIAAVVVRLSTKMMRLVAVDTWWMLVTTQASEQILPTTSDPPEQYHHWPGVPVARPQKVHPHGHDWDRDRLARSNTPWRFAHWTNSNIQRDRCRRHKRIAVEPRRSLSMRLGSGLVVPSKPRHRARINVS
eukprot:scaffold15561_cov179-Amphora_coffeaeformis.AAC.4